MASDPGLSVLMLRPLAQVLRRIDADAEGFLEALGVRADTSIDAFVSARRVDAALDRLARARGDESFGLTIARAALTAQLGFFGHLVWLAPTLGESIARAVRFYGLISERATIDLVVKGDRARVTQRLEQGAPHGGVLTEYLFASLVLRGERATGRPLTIRGVRFVHGPRDPSPYVALFGAPVAFGASLDTIDVARSDFDLPLATADATTAALLEERARAMARTLSPRDPFLDDVRRAILKRLEAHDPLRASLPGLAKDLALSVRTLQRRLGEHATSHRDLLDDVRREVAVQLLGGHAKPVVEVAYTLGFATPQAFHKAFHRWTGKTPGELRRGK